MCRRINISLEISKDQQTNCVLFYKPLWYSYVTKSNNANWLSCMTTIISVSWKHQTNVSFLCGSQGFIIIIFQECPIRYLEYLLKCNPPCCQLGTFLCCKGNLIDPDCWYRLWFKLFANYDRIIFCVICFLYLFYIHIINIPNKWRIIFQF